ncbi:hypothetical protein QF028_000309 [Neobacillus sp. B4I6]|uniref:spore germination protein n=1 Tax=Neobacillus sp. B4I6 TaxID=3373925 RepID=UPI003D23EF22
MPIFRNRGSKHLDSLSSDLTENVSIIKEQLENCSDIVYRPLFLNSKTTFFLIFIDGLCDTKALDEAVLKPLIFENLDKDFRGDFFSRVVRQKLVPIAQIQTESIIRGVIDGICCTIFANLCFNRLLGS